jgi:hypothetical protein
MFPFVLGCTEHLLQEYDIAPDTCFFAISGGNLGALCALMSRSPKALLSDLYLTTSAKLRAEPLLGLLGNHGLKPHPEKILSKNPLHDPLPPADLLRAELMRILPANIHRLASGRLFVVVSSWPWLGFRHVSEFPTKQALVDAVVCSCRFPVLVWRPQTLGGICGWGYTDIVDVIVEKLLLTGWVYFTCQLLIVSLPSFCFFVFLFLIRCVLRLCAFVLTSRGYAQAVFRRRGPKWADSLGHLHGFINPNLQT